MLPPDLRQTLVMVAHAMHDARDPWWVISSAAVALHGVAAVKVADVDVVTSVEDARRVMARLGVGPAKESASLMFRSTVFGQWKAPPLMVEIMAGSMSRLRRGGRRCFRGRACRSGWKRQPSMCRVVTNWPRCLGCSGARRMMSGSGCLPRNPSGQPGPTLPNAMENVGRHHVPHSVILTKVRTQGHTGRRSVPWILTFVRMTEGFLRIGSLPKRNAARVAQCFSPNSNRQAVTPSRRS